MCVNIKELQTQSFGRNQKNLPVILRFGLDRFQHHSVMGASYALNISCRSQTVAISPDFSIKSAMMFVLAPKTPELERGRWHKPSSLKIHALAWTSVFMAERSKL